LPNVLAELPAPLCRSCRKVDKKDCSAEVLAGEAPAVVVLFDPVAAPDVPVLAVDVPETVPPKSPISLANAAFKLDTVLDDDWGAVPAAEDAVPAAWLLLRLAMRDVSSAAMPWRPYRPTPVPLPEVVATGVAATGVVVTGAVVTGAVAAAVAAAVTAGVVVSVVVAAVVVVGVLFVAAVACVSPSECPEPW
jgi:hypothetical protein